MKASEKFLKLLEGAREGAENLKKSSEKAFAKAYKDILGLMKASEKSRQKVLKLAQAVVEPADPEEFEAAKQLVERFGLEKTILDHELAFDSLTRVKMVQAERSAGALWEIEKYIGMLVEEATRTGKGLPVAFLTSCQRSRPGPPVISSSGYDTRPLLRQRPGGRTSIPRHLRQE